MYGKSEELMFYVRVNNFTYILYIPNLGFQEENLFKFYYKSVG